MMRVVGRRTLLLGAGLGGCSLLPQRPYAERRDWPLEVRRPVVAPANPRGRVLLVRTMRAAPGLEAQGLQSIEADGSVRTDFYERWSAPPADAVEDMLRRWLAASGLFAAVLAPGSREAAELVLEGELLALIAAPAQAASRAAMGFVLLRTQGGRQSLVLQAEESGSAVLEGGSAAELAGSGRAAVAAMLGEVERRLAAALPERERRF